MARRHVAGKCNACGQDRLAWTHVTKAGGARGMRLCEPLTDASGRAIRYRNSGRYLPKPGGRLHRCNAWRAAHGLPALPADTPYETVPMDVNDGVNPEDTESAPGPVPEAPEAPEPEVTPEVTPEPTPEPEEAPEAPEAPETFPGEHPKFALLRAYALLGEFAYLYGKPGSGKTTGAMRVAASVGRECEAISLNPQTSESRLTGYLDAHGTFRETAFSRRYINGGVLIIDEIDNASDNLLTSLNSALENGKCNFPHGTFDMHPEFYVVATGNTCGRGGERNHAGRRALDSATIERFTFIDWAYDETLEKSLALKAAAARNVKASRAAAWVSWIVRVRAYALTAYPALVVSPRASIKGSRLLPLIDSGLIESAEALADAVLFKGIDKDTRSAILRAVPAPVVSR